MLGTVVSDGEAVESLFETFVIYILSALIYANEAVHKQKSKENKQVK